MAHEDLPLFNLNDDMQRARLVRHIESLKGRGLHRVEIRRVRNQRSLQQLGYYFAVVMPYAAKGLRDAWGEDVDSLGAHEFFKAEFLSHVFADIPVVNRKTGELMGKRRPHTSTSDLDVGEFSAYLEKVIRFCGEQLGIEVPPATTFAPEQKRKSA
jgi:hypothetical protein